jgi:phosphatidylserine/phosphatidylglycerophosphate/cardiolipin synthase-like enzyme
MIKIIKDKDHYDILIKETLKTKSELKISTADIKDMHVKINNSVVSYLGALNSLAKKGVAIKLLHAKFPGENFRKSFDSFPVLWKKMDRRMCPRVHSKIIVIDNRIAYVGSANFTGAGLGMKNENRRNFEAGILTDDKSLVSEISEYFDTIFEGYYCKHCQRKPYCPDPIVK